MSMLAERKRKQKWCLNPRGKDWSEDSNKFGQKLLEKMGWSKGKGLGANEDGITEHVKVSFKHDSKGMGFKEDQDPWTENEVGFANLLKNLSTQNTNSLKLGSDGGSDNSECADVLNIQSLENKSKSSRARVHYRKFTRGKDLSRYSAKDLAQIFGKSSLDIETSTTATSTLRAIKSDENQVTSTTNFGEQGEESYNENLTVSDTNMTEYFLRKMNGKNTKVETVTSSHADEENHLPEIDTTVPPTDTITTTYEKPAKASKKKKKKSHAVNEIYESQKPDSSQPEAVIKLKRIDCSPNIKPEYVAEKDASPKEVKLENGDDSKTTIPNKFQPYVELEKIDYYVETKNDCKKKKKHHDENSLKIKLKKKHTYDNPALNINDTSNDIENNNVNEVERKIKKKKKKKGIENPALELSNSDESATPKKKKRKTTFISYMNSNAENTLTVKSVPKKRKRSHLTEDLGYELTHDATKHSKRSMDNPTENTLTVKSIPKKRTRSHSTDELGYDNPAFTHISKKRSKLTMDNESGYDNPAFSQNNTTEFEGITTPNSKQGICNFGCEDYEDLPIAFSEVKKTGMVHVEYKKMPNNSTPKSALKKKTFDHVIVRPRKSVQINESINEEKYITDDSENEGDEDDEENTSISQRIDNYQTQLENSLNEKKCVNGKDHTSKKFKNIALKKLSQRRVSVVFPGVKHENIIKGYGNKN
ncbi:G patch domain-containing protein 4-like [Chrysoperla carnea]|uniref:G patch domain-containing protein 4-like n=1 Tax=Chrysoperla carnea TaxID=189513 RepID=UPI001D091B37|nr:G patch domain-containing protein 4-like [Chrysoperla carnea]